MRQFLALALYFGIALSQARAEDTPALGNPVDPRCEALQGAALINDLPIEFLTRLIWQESRFNDFAISRAGAQGIAQFMPATASGVKLANPFDAIAAIDKSSGSYGLKARSIRNLCCRQ
jgi:Transglycosylase SLT domain